MNDDPIELREWPDDPDDSGRAGAGLSPWERRRRVLRWISIIAMLGLVIPGALGTWSVARTTAAQACRIAVDFYAAPGVPARVAFELTDPRLLGWNCYALAPTGEVRIAVLGLIPGSPRLEPRTGT
jgi:hypothetical protein